MTSTVKRVVARINDPQGQLIAAGSFSSLKAALQWIEVYETYLDNATLTLFTKEI